MMQNPLTQILRKPTGYLLTLILAFPFAAFVMGFIDEYRMLLALALAIYLCLLILNFEFGFFALVLVRSSLDYFRASEPFNISALVTVALIFLCSFYVLLKRVNIFKFQETLPFLIFIGVASISIFVSENRLESQMDILRIVSIFCVYLITRATCDTPKKIKILLLVLLLSSVFPIGMAYFQHFTGTGLSTDFEHGRLLGTFSHPNSFSSYLMILLIFCVPQIMTKKPLYPKFLILCYVFLVFVIFLFTYSRGAWVVWILAMGLFGLIRYRKFLLLTPLLLVLVVLLVPSVKERWTYEDRISTYRKPSSMEWRRRLWDDIMPMVKKRPLTGNGLSMVEYKFQYEAHNDYIRLLAETGILGLLAYIFLFGRLLYGVIVDYKRSTTEFEKNITLAALVLVVGFILRAFVDNALSGTAVMIYYWLFVAVSRNVNLFKETQSKTS